MSRFELKTTFVLSCVAAIWLAGSSPLGAQEVRAVLGGRVVDPQGGVIPGAAVVVTSDDTGVKRETRTNEQGNWIVEFLLPGHYRFSVSVAGFKTAERSGIELQTSDNKRIDTQLEIGASTQS